jgi:pre-mRNA-splicing factor CDC5/CEF1
LNSQYNADIPFNKQPVPGFYDVNEENAKKAAAPVGQSLRQLEGKRRLELEELEDKKKRQKKDKGGAAQNTQFIAAREAQIQKLKETEQIIKRRKLNLPQPQVGEAELEDIVKIGRSNRAARDMVGGEGAAGELIGDYDALSRARSAKTPRTAPQGERSHRV